MHENNFTEYASINHPEQDGLGERLVSRVEFREKALFPSPARGNHLALYVQDNLRRVKILVSETAQKHQSNAKGKNESRFSLHFFIHFL